MKHYLDLIEKINQRYLTKEYDRVIIVLADEGHGKSTLIAETIFHFETKIKKRQLTIQDVFRHIVWQDADELRETLTGLPERSSVGVMDSARLLNRKEGMKDEQREIEKDIYDARAFNHLLLLGFQNPKSAPTDLANRRAKNLIYIPERGRLQVYSRSQMNAWDWEDTKDLPEASLTDTFPSLDDTPFWEEFKARDIEKKKERVGTETEETGSKIQYEVRDAVKEDLAYYVSQDLRDGTLYIDPEMISMEFEISATQASQVRKLLNRDPSIMIEDYRIQVGTETIKEIEREGSESGGTDGADDEPLAPSDVLSDIKENGVKKYVSQHTQTKQPYIDSELIEMAYGLSIRKASKVKKALQKEYAVGLEDGEITVTETSGS